MNGTKINVCPVNTFTTIHNVSHRYAVLSFTIGLRAANTPNWYTQRGSVRYAGRNQIGEHIPLFSRCIPGGLPAVPAAAGSFRIYGGPSIRTGLLPTETTDAETVGLFRGLFSPDNSDAPGRYVGLFAFTALGKPREEAISFELLPGGHQLGAVISKIGVTRPDANVLLCHDESGKITQGRGPYLDEGV